MARGRKGANDGARRELTKPPGLTTDEVALWDYTVAAQSAAWQIPGMEPLLYDFVVSACYLRKLYEKRALAMASPDNTIRDVADISEAITLEGRKLASVMTKLRLTPQSRTKETGSKTRPRMPWEDDSSTNDGDDET